MSIELIVGVAIKHKRGAVFVRQAPARHNHVIADMNACGAYDLDGRDHEQGFITSRGRFVTREEAARVAFDAGQGPPGTKPLKGLFSEDVW